VRAYNKGMGGEDDAELLDFVAARYPHLRRSAFLMCGDWAVAGEVVRETLARVVADLRRGAVEDPDTFAYAEVMAAFPRRHRRREHVFVAPPEAGPVLAHDPTQTILLLDALQKLAPQCRAVLVLRHWAALAVPEIAEVLDLAEERVEAYDAAGCAALESLLGDLVSP
jgi:DNA-directed RNA polymerase specialized sigma24 family protein